MRTIDSMFHETTRQICVWYLPHDMTIRLNETLDKIEIYLNEVVEGYQIIQAYEMLQYQSVDIIRVSIGAYVSGLEAGRLQRSM